MSYSNQAIIIVPWADIAAANVEAATWDTGGSGDQTFGTVRLSTDGNEPATHTGCCTRATDAMKILIDGATNPSAVYWTGSWAEALLAESLVQIPPDIEGP